MPMLDESFEVTKRIDSRLGGCLDHAHQEAAHVRPMAGLEEVGVLAEQNRQLQNALDGIVVQRRTHMPAKPHQAVPMRLQIFDGFSQWAVGLNQPLLLLLD
jgi:hypothetical protein